MSEETSRVSEEDDIGTASLLNADVGSENTAEVLLLYRKGEAGGRGVGAMILRV